MKKYISFIIFVFNILVAISLGCNAMAKMPIANYETPLYDEEVAAVEVFNGSNVYVSQDDLDLMAKVVYAESCAEPYTGKVAVASVILNRVKEPGFPKTIENVIKQKDAFSCVKNGIIAVSTDSTCYSAVIEALKGNDPTEKALFFYNPKTATSSWMKNVPKYRVKAIGNHVFFYSK